MVPLFREGIVCILHACVHGPLDQFNFTGIQELHNSYVDVRG